jgi:hypothetical protein
VDFEPLEKNDFFFAFSLLFRFFSIDAEANNRKKNLVEMLKIEFINEFPIKMRSN